MGVKQLLQLEGAALFFGAVYLLFFQMQVSWVWWLVVLVAPDVSMVGYLFNPRLGAILYNLGHTLAIAVPLALFGQGVYAIVGIAMIGHIGLDRMIGYGVKFRTSFTDTHLASSRLL